MSIEKILDSLSEEVVRYHGLASVAELETLKRGYQHKADTIQAAMALITKRIESFDSKQK